jgi:phasin family protein
MWLDCPVEETDQRGRKTRTTEARDNRRGIPQGSPIASHCKARHGAASRDRDEIKISLLLVRGWRNPDHSAVLTVSRELLAHEIAHHGNQIGRANMPSKIVKPNGSPTASAKTEAPADEFVKLMAHMNFPAIPDMNALMGAHSRNMEALAASMRIAVAGAQTVAKRQMEIMQQTVTDFTEGLRSLSTTDGQQANGALPAEWAKRTYQHAVANACELAELLQHSNQEAFDQLHRRFVAGMDEMGSMLEKGARTGA